jgi:hypothetical protein
MSRVFRRIRPNPVPIAPQRKTSFSSQPDTSTVPVCVSDCVSELIIIRLRSQKSSSSAINREQTCKV